MGLGGKEGERRVGGGEEWGEEVEWGRKDLGEGEEKKSGEKEGITK